MFSTNLYIVVLRKQIYTTRCLFQAQLWDIITAKKAVGNMPTAFVLYLAMLGA